MFMFLVGLSAGGLIVSSAPRVFGMEGEGNVASAILGEQIGTLVTA